VTAPTPHCRREMRAKPWLAGLLIIAIAVLAAFAADIRPAVAGPNEALGPFVPVATVETNASCFNTEHTFQAPGGFAAYCQAGGYIIYRVDTSVLPSDASNVRYSARFDGYGAAAGAQLEISLSPAVNSYPVQRYYTLTANKAAYETPFLTWNGNWPNNGMVYVKVARTAGTIYFDNLRLVMLYDTPLKANLSVEAHSLQTVFSGTAFSIDVTIKNDGPNIAKAASVSTNIPLGITGSFSPCTNNPVPGMAQSCGLGDIQPFQSKTVKLNVLTGDSYSGFLSFNFVVSSQTLDPNTSNNSVTRTVNVIASRTVTLCTEWENNNDSVLQGSKTFTYSIHHQSNVPSLTQTRQVSEGNTACATFQTRSELLNIVPSNHDGLQLANGYPKWTTLPANANGTSAVALPVSEWKVTFKVRAQVVAPTATPTQPAPTNTPAPQPTNTPTPAPTNTPAPQPTNTPIPQPTNTPAPQPTNPAPQPTNPPGAPAHHSVEPGRRQQPAGPGAGR
jgi:hypothetical protein